METRTSTATSALTSIGCVFQTNSDLFQSLYFCLSFFPHPSPAPLLLFSFAFCLVYVTYDVQRGAGGLGFYPEGFKFVSCSILCHCSKEKYRNTLMSWSYVYLNKVWAFKFPLIGCKCVCGMISSPVSNSGQHSNQEFLKFFLVHGDCHVSLPLWIFFSHSHNSLSFLLPPSTQACGVGVTGLNGGLCGSHHFFTEVRQLSQENCADCSVCISAPFTTLCLITYHLLCPDGQAGGQVGVGDTH